MGTEWIKFAAYGVILGAMGLKIWKRTHEESKLSLRSEFQPGLNGTTPPPLPPELSYQDIRPVGYTYAYRNCFLSGRRVSGSFSVADITRKVLADSASYRKLTLKHHNNTYIMVETALLSPTKDG